MKKLAALFLLLMTTAAIADTVYVPLFQAWDPGNAVGTLNEWIVNDLDPVLTDISDAGGGGGGGGGATLYPNLVTLISSISTPAGVSTIGTRGFATPGDGGAATYQWNAASYCAGGTMGSPTTADQIACILPSGQSASTAGRYLLQLGNGLDVRQIGMVADGVTDNSAYVATLMQVVNPNETQSSGMDVLFPTIPGQRYTDYYFSKPFHVYRSMTLTCQSVASGGGDSSVRLIFAAGVHGVVFDNPFTSPDGTGYGGGGMTSCGSYSKSYHEGFQATISSPNLTGVSSPKWGGGWDWEVGDGIVGFMYYPAGSAPIGVGGTVVTAQDSGAETLTVSPTPANINYTGNGNALFRLPVEKAFTVNTTMGSPTVTVTGGPSVLMPGDYVWSDAFPLGTPVLTVTGTVGAQTVTMGPYHMDNNNPTNATKSETGGHMWILPAGVKAFVQTSLHKNYLSGFAWGLEMECSAWGSPSAGCNDSMAEENTFYGNMLGRLVLGENAGASLSIMNVYAHDTIADVAELGSVGSTYISENGNSQEDSTSIYGQIGICSNSNSTTFFGGYTPTSGGYCTNGIGVATSPGGVVQFYNPIAGSPAGAPAIYNGGFHSPWFFDGDDTNQTQLCMNIVGAPLSFSHGNLNCTGPDTWALTYDNVGAGAWDWLFYGSAGGTPFRLTEGTLGGFGGYTAGNLGLVAFQQGLLLYDAGAGGGGLGSERLVDEGPSVPTGTFHQRGDIHFNQTVAAGYNFAWINVFAYFTTVGTVTQGVTTSVAVGGCPSPALPAGTPILDNNITPIPRLLGTLSSCSASTLTFQAAASGSATNGDTITFQEWLKVGTIQDAVPPAISSCGGGTPSVATGSNNIAGQFTMGTGSPTACTITFANAYPNHAFCTVSPASSGGAAITGGDYLSAMSNAGFTWTLGTGTSSLVFDYTCGGN